MTDRSPDQLLERLIPALADVPGVVAIVLGGSRARGTATASSDYDLGLYYGPRAQLDTDRLLDVAKGLVDDPRAAAVTPVGEWGPWIVGGGWLSIGGRKVDLLYRNGEAVTQVIHACTAGRINMDYQPGHPHGFCSAIWMGEVALCLPLHDPQAMIAELKAMTSPYPEALREALVRRFLWEVLFSIENGEIAIPRGEQTHIAGCAYRALCCIGQVLFALNRRYLINEKGALDEAAAFPLTIAELSGQAAAVWRAIGCGEFGDAFTTLRACEHELKALAAATS
ncbi:nucleotidyltransferase domain-containing protein [Methylocapsa sp. S129]|uniref:nucleotidyltransferase domain-containing protein n=1 Tax=Methylocapsa sp. S129 TaxID=1641869 RepID=UPI00131C61E3|nr:nucleotidyltransferase domain-containing protein [Methylocapsa sp. S129]